MTKNQVPMTKIAKKENQKKKQDSKPISPPSSGGRRTSEGQRQFELKLNINLRRLVMWVIILFLFVPFLVRLFQSEGVEEEMALSQVMADIREDKIEEVQVMGEILKLKYRGETQVKFSRKEANESFGELLKNNEIDPGKVNYRNVDQTMASIVSEIVRGLPYLILIGVFFLIIFKQARGAQDGLFSFGKSRARIFSKGKQSVTFKDVGGVKEAKQELEEVVDFLKHPRKYRKLGARTPKGVLLIGPSGTGKTLLARAVAGEAGVPFFSMAGSEFMEMLVGVGASRVRDLFETAKKAAPSVIFIDEIDAIGRIRGAGFAGGGHGEQEQTLNQILVEMDGFTPNDNVMVLAATNRPELLDPALIRPGRFDRRVTLDLPDIEERKKILLIHAKGKPFEKKVSWDKAAKRTVGFSGADLENMLNESAIQTARSEKTAIDMSEIEEAATKVKLGPEKKRLQTKLEKEMTAYHEAGHALVGHMLKGTDPVHRVSIVSRGMALGFTLMPPTQDKYNQTKSELLDKITAMLGGRAAEELVFKELTGGAASDIEKATEVARRMVVDLGMSSLGPVAWGPVVEQTEWGRAYIGQDQTGPETKSRVDIEVQKIINDAYKQAAAILKKNRKRLDRIAKRLIEVETLDGEEFEKLVGVKKAKLN